MEELSKASHHYARLLHPSREADPALRKRLARLRRWGATTVYPFLLNLYRDREIGTVTSKDSELILAMLESFLVRRAFANVPTNALNRIFIRLYSQLSSEADLVTATREALSQPGLRWPNDKDFQEAVLSYPLYQDSRPDQRRVILEALEESFQHKEPVKLEDLTTEHIMPQTLTSEWRKVLGPDAKEVHRRLLHTLGNLTLTGYNGQLSNHPFQRKQQLLKGSHLELSKEVSLQKDWSEEQIMRRGGSLGSRALSIWPGPIEVQVADGDLDRSTDAPPEIADLVRKKDEFLPDGTPEGKESAKKIRRILRNDYGYYVSRQNNSEED